MPRLKIFLIGKIGSFGAITLLFICNHSNAFQTHDQSLSYTHPAIVVDNDISYISLRDVPSGILISSASYWSPLLDTAPSGDPGDAPSTEPDDSNINPPEEESETNNYSNLGLEIYSSNKAYAQGSAVVPDSNHYDIYFAKTLVPAGDNAPPNSSYWLNKEEYLATEIPDISEIGEPPTISVSLSELDSLSIPVDDGTLNYYAVSVSIESNGSVTGGGMVEAGKSITLDATAEYGYEFLYWFFSSSEIYLDNPLTITPDKNLNISAVFKKKVNHQINITHQNEGEFFGEGNYFDGDTVNLAVLPQPEFKFLFWEIDEEKIYQNPWTFTADQNLTVSAKFETLTKYNLNLSHTDGGTTSGGGSFPEGSTASLLASADGGYMFYQWIYDNEISSSNPLELVVEKDLNITAIFKKFWILTVEESSNGSISGNQIRSVMDRNSVTLEADPDPGYVFQNWTGDIESVQNPFVIIPTSDFTVKPNFKKDMGDLDQDGLSNYDEIRIYQTNPYSSDSDGDGISDRLEIEYDLDPTISDLYLIKAIQLQKDNVSKPLVNGWFYTQELGWGWTSVSAHPYYYFRNEGENGMWINPYEKSQSVQVASSIKTLDLSKILSAASAVKSTDLKTLEDALYSANSDFPRYNDLTRKGFTEIESLALVESNFGQEKAIFLVEELNATPEQILSWAINPQAFYYQYPELINHHYSPIEILALIHLKMSISEILWLSEKYSAAELIVDKKFGVVTQSDILIKKILDGGVVLDSR
jgi:hypothetical protein